MTQPAQTPIGRQWRRSIPFCEPNVPEKICPNDCHRNVARLSIERCKQGVERCQALREVQSMCLVECPYDGVLEADTVVVSPDVGRLKMATNYAQNLNTSVVLLHKTRETGAEAHVTHLVGDVRGRSCLVVDDMISTGGTITEAVDKLVEMGARPEVVVAATHGVLLGGARAKLTAPPIGDVFVTDSIEQHTEGWPRLHVISVAPFLADAIRRLASGTVHPELHPTAQMPRGGGPGLAVYRT